MKRTKTSLLKSALALLLCVSMLIGSTFAWFTDKVTSKGNIIQSGNLDIEMYWTDDLSSGNWYNVEDDAHNTIFSYDKWEPGYTDVKYIKLVNKGNLAMNYKLTLTPQGSVGKLAEVINVFFADKAVDVQSREDLSKLGAIGLLNNVLNGGATANGTLLAKDQYSPLHPSGEVIMTIAMNMITTAGNDYQDQDSGEFTITALATQASFEKDSFGSDYDSNAEYPTIITGGTVTTQVNAVDGKVPAGGVTMTGNGISAFVPGGIEMAAGADALTLSVTPMEHTTTDITVVNNEILIPVDVHISGIAAGNTTPIVIDLGEVLPKYMNMGNYHLYHVENGANSTMTLVGNEADLTEHNRFTYDPLTGAVKVAMASFSEVALVADTTKAWEGEADYDWYTIKAKDAKDFKIANADQLYAFAKIVGGMNGEDAYDFDDATVTLLADINLNGGKATVDSKTKVFYPIGYYNNTSDKIYDRDDVVEPVSGVSSSVSSFSGTFDGNGHTISNFYQNTWEMFGDYNDGYSGTPNYYKDAMGLFGYVNGGTIKNLTVDNFSSDGEFTPTGVIAAYACNSTFENIAITNCEPRVYNTGNGGIVGIGGNSDDPEAYKLTFNNITIDNTNKITALWGSWDVACGGLVGMFRGAGHVHMKNCHVAAQMNVYNDVCGNYQYYWYRYSGMMVGTNKNMITDKDGYTVPETSKYHAENCTVHFGEWNDYYYCELVANSLASYTHDHQFSRLTEISSLDEIKSGDTWTKAGNFLLISGDAKTCYHIVNKNGTLTQHLHTDAGEETVGGKTVLKEDKQIVYLPFNQLFTGYGWGVKHIPVYNGKDYAFEGITILDREEAYSVKKFDYIGGNALNNNKEYTIGELFKEATIADKNMFIKHENVQVTVSPVEGSTVSGKYVGNTNDWTKGTLVFKGSGSAIITITDYYFCQTTTVVVSINDRENETKFEPKFTGDYLYRVGNQNNVSLGSLFKQANGTNTIDSASVTVGIKTLHGNATGTYTHNATWTNSTIKFEGTGVVAISIQDGDFCNATVLNLEIVDATNVAEGGKIGNYNTTSVLLGNTTVSTLYLNGGATLYGNGFTIDCTNSPITGSGSVSENYIIGLVDAHLDNVNIVGMVYTEYGAMASNDYNRALVVSKGNSTITNCYLSNTASPIRLVEGNLEVKGATVKGGNFANIDVRNGHLTLEDVTTINQALGNDKADNGSTVIGLGIVVYYENVDTSLTSITVKGKLKQYNHISSNDKFSHEYATQLVKEMMSSTYSDLQNTINGVTWVNPGIIEMTKLQARTGYTGREIRFYAQDGYVLAVKPTADGVTENPEEYKTRVQGFIAPAYSFDYTNKNYIAKTDGSNDYCYYEGGQVLIAMDQGDTFNWDPFILTATKYGNTLNHTVTMNGTTYTSGQKIPFNTSGNYVVTYTYTDSNNYVLEDGKLTTKDVAYAKTVNISVSVIKPATQHATFTFADTNTATEKLTVNDKTYISAKGVSATDKEWGYITVNGTKIFYPITEAQMKTSSKLLGGKETQVYYYVFKDAVTITDYKDGGTGGAQDYNADTKTMPSNLTVVNGMEAKYTAISSACVDISKLTKKGSDGEVWDFSASTTVSGTTTYNNYLAHQSPSGLSVKSGTRDYDAITVAQFSYTDAAGATYYYFVGYFMPNQNTSSGGGGSTGCLAEGTMITLADGTQKPIEQITYEDELLAWDFHTGTYAVTVPSLIEAHKKGEYRIINLQFADGTTVKVVVDHGFFDVAENNFVVINEDNADSYIGHKFVKLSANGTYEYVELVDYEITVEETTYYSIQTAVYNNSIADNMFTLPAPPEILENDGWFDYFEIGEGMKYDEAKMQADIEKHGLYEYSDFAEYVTYEQFIAFNGPYLKVLVGRGVLTFEQILELIATYVK